jgi:hypothetical protein
MPFPLSVVMAKLWIAGEYSISLTATYADALTDESDMIEPFTFNGSLTKDSHLLLFDYCLDIQPTVYGVSYLFVGCWDINLLTQLTVVAFQLLSDVVMKTLHSLFTTRPRQSSLSAELNKDIISVRGYVHQ